jgi:hypothetical protein
LLSSDTARRPPPPESHSSTPLLALLPTSARDRSGSHATAASPVQPDMPGEHGSGHESTAPLGRT